MVTETFDAFLEGGSQDSLLLSQRALACSDTRIKLSDSTLYSDFTGIHIECVVVEKIDVDWWCREVVGWPRTICGREVYGRAYTIGVDVDA